MRSDLTDITVVMDRSGSMESCRTDAEGGLNAFIDQQKSEPGEALFTLVQFDNEYEFVHSAVPIKSVPRYTLLPRGSTALLDAVGRAIVETGERLSKMAEADRPGLVVFVIITDGEENASKEFKKAQIKAMIERQSSAYSWQFTFLGANQDAFAEGAAIGIAAGAIMNHTVGTTKAAYAAAAGNVGRMRMASRLAQKVVNAFTGAERAESEKKT
jgi:uncharacterized protein YegL